MRGDLLALSLTSLNLLQIFKGISCPFLDEDKSVDRQSEGTVLYIGGTHE